MNPHTGLFTSFNRVVFVLGVVFLISTLGAVIFVAASSNDGIPPAIPLAATATDTSAKAQIAHRFGELPLSFEINKGQTDDSVKFLSHGPGYDLFLGANEAVLSLQQPQAVLRLKMIGANAASRVEGEEELPGKVNYFIGNDREQWRRNVPTYRKVHYTNVYPGIDLVYYGNQRELEYDFVVGAGANPKLIRFSVAGAERLRLDQQGNVLLALKHGEVRLNKPFVYQLTDEGNRSEVKGSYVINGNEIRFKVRGADSGKPLVIDPVLSYSTFLGGNGDDQAFGIAVDAQGSAYVTGTTNSLFPTTPGAFNTNPLDGAFVTKLDPTGTTLIYSTFLSGREHGSVIVGGSPSTGSTAIVVDSSGNAHITGVTSALDFPVVNPLKTSGIFFKTTNGGSAWSNNNAAPSEGLNCLAVAPSNPNVIYAGSFQGVYRSTDARAIWTKTSTVNLPDNPSINTLAVDPTNPLIVYAGSEGLFKSTDGGNNWSPSAPFTGIVRAIVFDPTTPSTVYAGTSSGLFRSNDSGNTWNGINTFGFPTDRDILSIAIDPTARTTIYVGTLGHGLFKTSDGGTSWIPINNGITSGFGTNSRVVDDVVIDPASPSTLYVNVVGTINKSTNGGSSWAPLHNINVGIGINAMVATPATLYVGSVGHGVIKTTDGGTSWTGVNNGLWTANIRVLAVDPSNSAALYAGGSEPIFSTDAFVSTLNPTGSDLLFSTYLGGSGNETGNGIAVDGSGNIYVAGNTSSENFPTQNPFQAGPSPTESGGNGFVTKLNPSVPSYVFSTYLGGSAKDDANSIAIDSANNVYVTGKTVSADFPTVVNTFQTKLGDTVNGDAFVTKFNSSGSSLIYSTYLGGNGSDNGSGIAVDVSGNAYVTGQTSSTDFPTANPIQATSGGSGDAFVTKLNSQGSALVYSTYLGGSEIDVARGIVVDATGNAYVTGRSSSLDFPVVAGAIRTRSEIYKSVDGGASWTNDNYGLTKSAVFQLAVHPTQSGTIYAGTPDGMFRSTNGGRTWSAINNGLDSRRVNAIVIDPLTPSTVYTATNFGVYKSPDGGNSWNLRSNGMSSTRVMGLAIDPVTPATLYAATLGGPIYKTTDGANNWTQTGSGGPVAPFAIAVDPHNPTTVYVTDFLGAAPVFKSTNAGASWQTTGLNDTGSGLFVKVSPHTPNLVFATMSIGGVFKSVDGGNNWTPLRSDAGEIVFDPVDSSTLYFVASPIGVLKSTNGGQTWTPIAKGLNVSTAFALAVDPLKPSTLYISTASSGDDDAFVTKINPSGSALVYSTLIGGIPGPNATSSINDEAFGIALDTAGNAYITGGTSSPNFPTTSNSYQPVNLGFTDVFISKVTMSHIISGHVLDGGGAPVSGAEVVLNDGASLSVVVTGSDGSYEFSHLREGGSFTVSAAKPHFTMAPPSQNFSNLNSNQTLDFTATPTNAPFFTIGGQVIDNGIGLAGITVTLSGSQSGLRTTDNNGNYSFEVAGGGNYSVTASVAALSFNPPNQSFNNLSASQTANFAASRQSFVVTNTNNHGTGSLREAITNANATPGADTITFNIPGPGVKVMDLLTPLPEITDPVVIDATTQPGYAGAPLIELNGDNIASQNGLVITASNTTVRGLAIGGFDSGIVLRSCNNNLIQGNYIGIDASGTQPRRNHTGVLLTDSSNNLIGGTTAAARNVISGNDQGINIESPGNTVQGNLIGTDFTGTKKIGNLFGINANTPNTLIGGVTPGARNVISGNGSSGVSLGGSGSKLQGNFIGTDITGTQPLSNNGGGVISGTNALIGGTVPEARNVISGNVGFGNVVLGASPFGPGAIVQGNYIGTDVTGTRALSQTTGFGIVIVGSNNLIGGTIPGAQNVISGNISGIQVGSFSSEPAQGNVIQGNLIGLNALGTGPLPNSQWGIAFIDAFNNAVGGIQSGEANRIAFNGGEGVISLSGTRISVRGNSVFSNGRLGIDLDGNGVTANDPADADQGANNLQNFPVLTSVMSVGNNTTIQGTLNSTPNKTFQIDFYSSAALDASGHGEGALYIGTTPVTTDANGNATINATFAVPLGEDRVVTATATDSEGNTSEFSAGDATSAVGNVQFSVSSIQVNEDLGLLTVTVLRKGGSAGSLSIDYATIDGTATAGQDYTATSGTLTFSGGETSKSFQIPITNDAVTEPDETFTVELSNAPSLEALGAPSSLLVTIQDRTTVPVIAPGIISVIEGDTGSTTDALFTFNLSAATSRSVSVHYATANGSATGGASCGNQGTDYQTTSGTISFDPGTTAVTIPVKICGDSSAEAHETFSIDLSSASNATLANGQASGTIIDDDFLVLLFDESDPNRPAALDAFFFVRDPFHVLLPEWFPTAGTDRNTRVMFFVRGLELNPGEAPSAVEVGMGNGIEFFDVPAEDVRAVPGVDFTQVTVRLPDGMAPGAYSVFIKAHSRTTSSVGVIQIAP